MQRDNLGPSFFFLKTRRSGPYIRTETRAYEHAFWCVIPTYSSAMYHPHLFLALPQAGPRLLPRHRHPSTRQRYKSQRARRRQRAPCNALAVRAFRTYSRARTGTRKGEREGKRKVKKRRGISYSNMTISQPIGCTSKIA